MRALIEAAGYACAAYLIGLALAAPVPPARPRPRPALPGSYTMTFCGADYPTVLLDDGGYAAQAHQPGRRWEGTWALKGDTLTIRERLVCLLRGPESDWAEYAFTLRPGRLDSTCGRLRLAPVR